MTAPSVPCGVIVFDDRLRIEDANAFAARVLDRSIDELKEMSIPDLLNRAGIMFFNTHVNPSLAMHGRADEVYLDFRTRRGDAIPVLINAQRHGDGDKLSVIAFVPMQRRRLFEHELIAARDASVEAARAEKEAHEQVNRAQAQLALRERLASLGTLAHGIAHEINNPLTSVLANLDTLSHELSDGKGHQSPAALLELVVEASVGAERIHEITRQMGYLVRADEMPCVPIDLKRVANLAVRMTRAQTRERARVATALEEVPIVEADSGRLGQVLINLIANAVQAFGDRPKSENEIWIRTGKAADGNAIIEVSDNGPGIPPEIAAHVFEPFFTTKPVGEGTGLGLSISEGLIASLGGTLGLETEVGRGSTFRISLPPFVPAAAEADAKVTTALRRVLVVDDDVGVSRAIARLLRRYDVTTARSADEALEHVRRDPPFDFVFSDLRMPDKDGLAFHAALMEVDPVLARRTAFVTSALGERDLFEIRRRGVPIFDKPINVRKLLDFCDEVIPVKPPP